MKRFDIVEQAETIKRQTLLQITNLEQFGAQQLTQSAADGKNIPANAGIISSSFSNWKENTNYKRGDLFNYNGNLGFVKQDHTSQINWLPFSTGTEALYGARPAPDKDGVYPYIYNMMAEENMEVKDQDKIYLCIQNIESVLYPPSQLPAFFKEM